MRTQESPELHKQPFGLSCNSSQILGRAEFVLFIRIIPFSDFEPQRDYLAKFAMLNPAGLECFVEDVASSSKQHQKKTNTSSSSRRFGNVENLGNTLIVIYLQ
jgi:hypothetical protein